MLVDSYVIQLVSTGRWEWAVYILLCNLNSWNSDSINAQCRIMKARDLVMRNFTNNKSTRVFLGERIGIPLDWLEEASAARCAYLFDDSGTIKHLLAYSSTDACKAIEERLLPNLLFKGRGAAQQYMKLMNEIVSDDEFSIGVVIYDFLRVSEDVRNLSRLSKDECNHRMAEINDLYAEARDLQTAIFDMEKASMLTRDVRVSGMVSRESFLAEASWGISFLTQQLQALKQGYSLLEDQRVIGSSGMTRLKTASQLAFLNRGGNDANIVSSSLLMEHALIGVA
jgi:hypothetical protein